MSKIVWRKGKPPHVGWWLCKDGIPVFWREWRWWNGTSWSYVCYESQTGKDAAASAKSEACQRWIEWSDYYPPNARVPRINPTGGTT